MMQAGPILRSTAFHNAGRQAGGFAMYFKRTWDTSTYKILHLIIRQTDAPTCTSLRELNLYLSYNTVQPKGSEVLPEGGASQRRLQMG